MTHWTDKLVSLNACPEAVKWARDYDSLEAAWDACQRGDHMLWLAGRLAGPPWSDSRRPLVRAAALCAETALPYVRDEWVAGVALATVQTLMAWSYGEATDEDVHEARIAAADAAYAAAAYAAAASDDAAAYAYAYDASASAAASVAAAYAYADAAAYAYAYDASASAAASVAAAYAYADAAAASYAYAAATRTRVLAQCADIVRANLDCPVLP